MSRRCTCPTFWSQTVPFARKGLAQSSATSRNLGCPNEVSTLPAGVRFGADPPRVETCLGDNVLLKEHGSADVEPAAPHLFQSQNQLRHTVLAEPLVPTFLYCADSHLKRAVYFEAKRGNPLVRLQLKSCLLSSEPYCPRLTPGTCVPMVSRGLRAIAEGWRRMNRREVMG
jgi:hypothetical protein